MEYLMIMVSAIFINNFVVVQFLGICPFLGVSKDFKSALGMGLAVTFVMTLTCLITYPIYTLVLVPLGLEYLEIIVFIFVIASLVQMIEMALKRFSPTLYNAMGIYLPLITTNCAVLGVTINNIKDEYTFIEAIVSALGCGLGFLLAIVLFAGVRTRLESENIPTCFKGLPITLIAASYVALAFSGFSGVIENIFG
jgi:electron transport complex protein RnfA